MRTLLSLLVFIATTPAAHTQVLDTQFGIQGVATLSLENGRPELMKMRIDSQNRIVLCGQYAPQPSNDSLNDLLLARFSGSGMPDFNFGDNGVLIDPLIAEGDDRAADIQFQEDGGIVALLRLSVTGPSPRTGLLFLNEDGSRNNNFGENGLQLHTGMWGTFDMRDFFILDDGSFLAHGRGQYETSVDGQRIMLMKFTPDGLRDFSFSENGIYTRPNGIFSSPSPSDAAIYENKLVSVGRVFEFPWSAYHLIAARLNIIPPSEDDSFNVGATFEELVPNASYNYTDVLIDENNYTTIAGHYGENNNLNIRLFRLTPNGELDPSFNNGEPLIVDHAGYSEQCRGLVQLENGDYIVGSYSFNPETSSIDWNLLRITMWGDVMQQFGDNGWFTLDFDGDDDLRSILQTEDNAILMMGGIGGSGPDGDLAVAKVLPDEGLSTAKIDRSNEVLVYPNPSHGEIFVDGSLIESIRVSSIDGQVVLSTNEREIDMTVYPRGVYLVYIKSNKSTIVKRLILK